MRLWATLKSSFVAGLILITPLVVTLYVLRILVDWSLRFLNPIVRETRLVDYTANIEVAAQAIALVSILVAITVLGFLARRSSGERLFGSLGRVVAIVPLVNTIYASVRQVANSLVRRETAYDNVVLVEYPRKGSYTIGLVTGRSPSEVEDVVGQPAYNVFLPHSPNPTAGRLLLLPEDRIEEIDMSVSRGMRLIVTTGLGDGDGGPAPELKEDAPARVVGER